MIALEYRESNTAEPSFILSNRYLYCNSRVLIPGPGRGGEGDESQAPGWSSVVGQKLKF